MIEMQKATDYKNYDLIVLYLFLSNYQKLDSDDFFAQKSFALINQRIGKSKFLRQMLPAPLIILISQGDSKRAADFMALESVANSELVWSQQSSCELV